MFSLVLRCGCQFDDCLSVWGTNWNYLSVSQILATSYASFQKLVSAFRYALLSNLLPADHPHTTWDALFGCQENISSKSKTVFELKLTFRKLLLSASTGTVWAVKRTKKQKHKQRQRLAQAQDIVPCYVRYGKYKQYHHNPQTGIYLRWRDICRSGRYEIFGLGASVADGRMIPWGKVTFTKRH